MAPQPSIHGGPSISTATVLKQHRGNIYTAVEVTEGVNKPSRHSEVAFPTNEVKGRVHAWGQGTHFKVYAIETWKCAWKNLDANGRLGTTQLVSSCTSVFQTCKRLSSRKLSLPQLLSHSTMFHGMFVSIGHLGPLRPFHAPISSEDTITLDIPSTSLIDARNITTAHGKPISVFAKETYNLVAMEP
eukprot:scaffold435_cov342-Pavlova_lutheri.AAC.13